VCCLRCLDRVGLDSLPSATKYSDPRTVWRVPNPEVCFRFTIGRENLRVNGFLKHWRVPNISGSVLVLMWLPTLLAACGVGSCNGYGREVLYLEACRVCEDATYSCVCNSACKYDCAPCGSRVSVLDLARVVFMCSTAHELNIYIYIYR
jgi:hypothetical protein